MSCESCIVLWLKFLVFSVAFNFISSSNVFLEENQLNHQELFQNLQIEQQRKLDQAESTQVQSNNNSPSGQYISLSLQQQQYNNLITTQLYVGSNNTQENFALDFNLGFIEVSEDIYCKKYNQTTGLCLNKTTNYTNFTFSYLNSSIQSYKMIDIIKTTTSQSNINYTFLVTSNQSINSYYNRINYGSFGFVLNEDQQTKNYGLSSLLTQLQSNKVIASRVAALYLGSKVLHLGDFDVSLAQSLSLRNVSDMIWHQPYDKSKIQFNVGIQEIQLKSSKLDGIASLYATFDTTRNDLQFSVVDYNVLLKKFNDITSCKSLTQSAVNINDFLSYQENLTNYYTNNAKISCHCSSLTDSAMPSIGFVFNGTYYGFLPSEYMNFQKDLQKCTPRIFMNPALQNQTVIGSLFFQKFYGIFDQDNQRMSFAGVTGSQNSSNLKYLLLLLLIIGIAAVIVGVICFCLTKKQLKRQATIFKKMNLTKSQVRRFTDQQAQHHKEEELDQKNEKEKQDDLEAEEDKHKLKEKQIVSDREVNQDMKNQSREEDNSDDNQKLHNKKHQEERQQKLSQEQDQKIDQKERQRKSSDQSQKQRWNEMRKNRHPPPSNETTSEKHNFNKI